MALDGTQLLVLKVPKAVSYSTNNAYLRLSTGLAVSSFMQELFSFYPTIPACQLSHEEGSMCLIMEERLAN